MFACKAPILAVLLLVVFLRLPALSQPSEKPRTVDSTLSQALAQIKRGQSVRLRAKQVGRIQGMFSKHTADSLFLMKRDGRHWVPAIGTPLIDVDAVWTLSNNTLKGTAIGIFVGGGLGYLAYTTSGPSKSCRDDPSCIFIYEFFLLPREWFLIVTPIIGGVIGMIVGHFSSRAHLIYESPYYKQKSSELSLRQNSDSDLRLERSNVTTIASSNNHAEGKRSHLIRLSMSPDFKGGMYITASIAF